MKKIVQFFVMVLGLLGVANNIQAATINLVHSFGPDTAAFQADFVEKLIAGSLSDGTPATSSDARRVRALFPEHVMLKSSGNGFVWLGVVLTAGPSETVALGDLSVLLKSYEDGNTINRLGKSVLFSFYSTTAPGLRLDGTRVTVGAADQRVNGKVVVVVGYKSLPVSTSGEESGVKTWFYGNNVRLESTVSAPGASTSTLILRQLPPSLVGGVVNGQFIVTAVNTGDPRNYEVQVASVVNGPWASAGQTLRAGLQLDLGPVSANPSRFVRLVSP